LRRANAELQIGHGQMLAEAARINRRPPLL
jgi:hypothetical protein